MIAQELKFFDMMAARWDGRETMSSPDKVREILQLIMISKGDDVLDLGTGTGVLLPELCRLVTESGSVTAVDLSSRMLVEARRKSENLSPRPELIYADFENDILTGLYDHILMYCVYPHIEQPVRTLRKLRSCNLKPGGKISIAFPCSADVINNIHGHNPVDSNRLQPPVLLAEFLNRNNLPAEVIADTQHIYIVSIRD